MLFAVQLDEQPAGKQKPEPAIFKAEQTTLLKESLLQSKLGFRFQFIFHECQGSV